jgi:rubrerythrin
MPGTVRRTTIVEVLDVALELERKTMELYAEFVRVFERDDELRQFWFNMARGEAAHCGALMLVEAIVRNDPSFTTETKVLFDTSTGIRLRSLLTGYRREVRRGIGPERAFEMAIDLESSELEDVVVDLLQVVRDPGWRDQAVKLLIHDMGDLSYMIEKRTRDAELLARADALVERRMGRPAAGRAARRGGRPRRKAVS